MSLDLTQFHAWRKANDLSDLIYEMTKTFPQDERYNLISQMRKAASSIGANIAEGYSRWTYPDKKHKYIQARGELVEIINFIHQSYRVNYITKEQKKHALIITSEEHKIMNGIIKSMQKNIP